MDETHLGLGWSLTTPNEQTKNAFNYVSFFQGSETILGIILFQETYIMMLQGETLFGITIPLLVFLWCRLACLILGIYTLLGIACVTRS